MQTSVKRALMVGGASLLAVVAVLGWTKRPSPQTPPAIPSSYSTEAEQSSLPPADPSAPAPAASRYYDSEAAAAAPEPQPAPAAYPARTNSSRAYAAAEPNHGTRVVTQKRSTKKSVAIVGGSAAAGAVIGALAGGGKGAAIGALAGGGGGFVYDRATRKKKKVVQY